MPDPIGPSQGNHYTYRQDFDQSRELFAASAQGYKEATFAQKKEAFKKAMDESYHVMMQSASAMVGKEIGKAKGTIDKDYMAFKQNPTDQNLQKLRDDINRI